MRYEVKTIRLLQSEQNFWFDSEEVGETDKAWKVRSIDSEFFVTAVPLSNPNKARSFYTDITVYVQLL